TERKNRTGGLTATPASQGAAQQRRSAFQRRASSLEDAASLARRTQGFQEKFTEELQRIKKLSGRPGPKKAFSTEQLAQRDPEKLQPIPPQVLRKLEARERALEEQQREGGGGGGGGGESEGETRSDRAPGDGTADSRRGRIPSSQGSEKISSVAMETGPVCRLPAGPVPTVRTRSTARGEEVAGGREVVQGNRHPRGKALSGADERLCSTCYEEEVRPELGPAHKHRGSPTRARNASGSSQSDEGSLTQKEEAMELEVPPTRGKQVHFQDPPSFQVAPYDQAVGEGQDVFLSVRARGCPSIYWLKERLTLKTAGRLAVRQTGEGTSELRISAAQRSDTGLYACKIVNEFGTKQCDFRLEVKAPTALAVTREIRDTVARAGEAAMFECHVTGPPDVEVDWLSNGKLIQPALLHCKMHFDGKRCRLLLNSVHEDDSGTYTCKLSTTKGELTSSAALKVTPTRAPLFTRRLDVLEVIEGRGARFDCKVSGSPAPSVTWMHFDAAVEEGDNVRVLREGGRHSLVIGRVGVDLEGFYTAVALNEHGTADTTAELYLQEPRTASANASHTPKLEKMPSIPEEPEVLEGEVERRTMPDFAQPLADVEVVEGKEAVLRCRAAGLPYPSIAWYHNGKRIDGSEERKMTQHRDVHSLVIRAACHAHGGVYKSVISNRVGKAACYAHLYVTDIVPDPPDGPPVVESITGKTITLSWKKPKRMDQSSEALSLLYVVQQQALGSIQWSVVASSLRGTTYTVDSLCKGVRYAFRVLSSTGKAISKPSPSTDLLQLQDRGPYLRKAPIIMEKPDVVHVVENRPANVTITLNHVHALVTWKRRGAVLVHRPGVCEISMPDDDQHTLRVLRVQTADVGELVVSANNQFGSDICTLQLTLAAPPKFESIMEDQEVEAGQTTRLAVVVEGRPDPDILWFKDDALLSESSHCTFVYDDPECSLVVLNARPEDSGVYTCTAKNLAGTVSCKAEVTVHAEMALLAELDHDKIVFFHDAFEKKNTLVLVLELCHEELLERMAKKTSLSETEIRSSVRQILEGLGYLHQKDIAHLDVKPENILMAEPAGGQIRICDLGSAVKLEGRGQQHYCRYGTPEYVAPEIVNQTPVSTATDICLTGVSPFAGENDRASALNVRGYNVAFEEGMFSGLCKEAKGFVIKLLVVNRLRPTAVECLRHPWFKSSSNKTVNTAMLKQVLSRRRWQRSLISYKSKMSMRTIPDLLDDSSSHVSIAVGRHLKEGSPPASSSSDDSDEDVDELPFIPMPLSMVFSGSRVSLNEIPGDEDTVEGPGWNAEGATRGRDDKRSATRRVGGGDNNRSAEDKEGEDISEEQKEGKQKRGLLQKGLSVEADDSQTKARRVTMKRGSSADSALLLHIEPVEGTDATGGKHPEAADKKSLKKAVSMELPNRSPSPGASKLSQEDYALKLELMRQRLLRGGGGDKKMSGLRGPLFETLGMSDDRRTGSLDRNPRRSRAVAPSLARAASSEASTDETLKTKVFRKSSSFTQGDSEPMPLHRRYGAPLEIPSLSQGSLEPKKLLEATSMSALVEMTPLNAPQALASETTINLGRVDQQEQQNDAPHLDGQQSNEHPAVFAKVATADYTITHHPVLRTDIKDIDSEEVFQARFKKRESSLTRGLRRLTRNKSEERSPVLSQKGEEVYRPGLKGAPIEMVAKGLEKSKSVQDLREVEKEGLSLIGRLSMRTKRSSSLVDKKIDNPIEAQVEKVPEFSASKQRKSWGIGRSKSLDTKELDHPGAQQRRLSEKEPSKVEESSVFAMRRKFESKVAGISAKIRTQSDERKEKEVKRRPADDGIQKDLKMVSDSPVLAMKKKFENKVSDISSKIRSQSEERQGETETQSEGKRTPLFTRHRHSQSEGRGLKEMGIPENQLAQQTGTSTASKESFESALSVNSENKSCRTPESDRRSRWDRWGLTRSKRDKTPSQPELSVTPAAPKDDDSLTAQQLPRLASDFPPVFHIKLKDRVLLDGDPVTLSCLPAGSPPPKITWTKDRKPVEVDNRVSLISHQDGRQLLVIMKTNQKDAGLYECVAANTLATITSSCTLCLARVPKRPGTPEVPQVYNNTALVLWKPATDGKSPCSYTLERCTEGEEKCLISATGVTDCYYNVTELPPGGAFRFRVACVNKAGQGPYSNWSPKVEHRDSPTWPSSRHFLFPQCLQCPSASSHGPCASAQEHSSF
ncbi:hypothetical protein NHX12_014947, partial [Muraenolepis orangiensis]